MKIEFSDCVATFAMFMVDNPEKDTAGEFFANVHNWAVELPEDEPAFITAHPCTVLFADVCRMDRETAKRLIVKLFANLCKAYAEQARPGVLRYYARQLLAALWLWDMPWDIGESNANDNAGSDA